MVYPVLVQTIEFYNLICKVSGDLRNHEVAFLASLPKIEWIYTFGNYQINHITSTMSSN